MDFRLVMISEDDFKRYGCPYCNFGGGVHLITNPDGVLLVCGGQFCSQVYFIAKNPESLVNTETYPNFLLPSEHPFAKGLTSRIQQSFWLPFMPTLRCFKCPNLVNYQTVLRFKIWLTPAGLREVVQTLEEKHGINPLERRLDWLNNDTPFADDSRNLLTIFHDTIHDHLIGMYSPHSLIELDAFNVTLALIWIGACPVHEDDLQEVKWLKTMRAAIEEVKGGAKKESAPQGSKSSLPEQIDLEQLTIESMLKEWKAEDQDGQSS